MHQSLSEMAQLTLHSSFNATAIQSYRQKVKAAAELLGLSNITLNDIILFAVSRVIKKHKALNAHYTGTSMKYFNHVHLGMAVDTDRGLMVPTIFNADQKSLNEIAIESKKLAEACRTGKINPDLLQGGTFTVTNLGGLGVESFTPVINPPQTAILGVCNIVQMTLAPCIPPWACLDLDHRRWTVRRCEVLKDLTKLWKLRINGDIKKRMME